MNWDLFFYSLSDVISVFFFVFVRPRKKGFLREEPMNDLSWRILTFSAAIASNHNRKYSIVTVNVATIICCRHIIFAEMFCYLERAWLWHSLNFVYFFFLFSRIILNNFFIRFYSFLRFSSSCSSFLSTYFFSTFSFIIFILYSYIRIPFCNTSFYQSRQNVLSLWP